MAAILKACWTRWLLWPTHPFSHQIYSSCHWRNIQVPCILSYPCPDLPQSICSLLQQFQSQWFLLFFPLSSPEVCFRVWGPDESDCFHGSIKYLWWFACRKFYKFLHPACLAFERSWGVILLQGTTWWWLLAYSWGWGSWWLSQCYHVSGILVFQPRQRWSRYRLQRISWLSWLRISLLNACEWLGKLLRTRLLQVSERFHTNRNNWWNQNLRLWRHRAMYYF